MSKKNNQKFLGYGNNRKYTEKENYSQKNLIDFCTEKWIGKSEFCFL